MSFYKTFAIVGFGYTGSVLAIHFTDHKEDNFKWRILSGSVSPHPFDNETLLLINILTRVFMKQDPKVPNSSPSTIVRKKA